MKKALLVSLLLGGASTGTIAQSVDDSKPLTITPQVSIEQFNWIENYTTGKAGIKFELKPSSKLNINLDLGAYKNINKPYATQSSGNALSINFSDYKTAPPYSASINPLYNQPKTNLSGFYANIDAGVPFKLSDTSKISIEPFIGLEGKVWSRSLVYGQEGEQTVFEEKYKFLSPSLGAKLNYTSKSKVKLTLRIGVSYPALSKLKTDEKNLTAPNTEFNLSKHLSPSIEASAKMKKLTIKIRYERLNLGSTDSLKGVTQPSTKANVTGFSIGYDF